MIPARSAASTSGRKMISWTGEPWSKLKIRMYVETTAKSKASAENPSASCPGCDQSWRASQKMTSVPTANTAVVIQAQRS